MKNSLKVTVIIICLFFATSATAQVNFGIKAGANGSFLSDYNYEASTTEIVVTTETKYKSGIHLGLIWQINLPVTNLFIQPELLYSMLGVKADVKTSFTGINKKASIIANAHYVQIPVYLGYKINAGLGLDVILGVGPYAAYGIGGDYDFFDTFNRFDFGFTAMGGVEFNQFQITIGYDLGVVNVDNSKIENASSIYNRNAKVSVGYFF